uniref:NADH:ubiquinone reductase (H(+)-translocating) n=1 Tax=Encyrtus aurantii TaxID=2860127 RepID=A0AA50ZNG4_9HYME|nr:NADH dehydrogenase subunit 5 [Encyrtus aurantii]
MMLFYLLALIFFLNSLIFFIISLLFMYFNYSLFMNWSIFFMKSINMNMFIYIDWMTLMFLFTVLLISSMIFFYCCEYMSGDSNINRFFYLIYFFVISMILMIISPSLLTIIIGWDGLGLISYGLVIYYQSIFSYNSGMLTILMNRVGDVMIILSISIMFISGSWEFMFKNFSNKILLLMIIIASFTKSAQFPFSSWLPAAMAAPTPVSSLVHSSTLVTAGVYLLIRFKDLIYLYDNLLNLILYIGLLTMMFSGFSALNEFDLKKIIAYSTLSQLGLMMMTYSFKFYILAFFHLIIHAMFKSMMFMCSGIFIHSLKNYQDIRFMGNSMEFMPLTTMIFLISNFSLCGMPFFSGFYSKDLILEKIFMHMNSLMLYLCLILATMLTVMYSFRLMYYLINKNFNFSCFFSINDIKLMNYSLFILFFNSLCLGYILNWFMFLNIEDVYMLYLEKIQILFFCFFAILFMLAIMKMKMKIYMFNFFFGKMWMLYYINFYLNLFTINLLNFYFFIADKGMTFYIVEYSFKNFFYKITLIHMNFFNNLVFKFLFFISFIMILIFTFI